MTAIYPFNNRIETGLRSLFILTYCYPRTFDLDYLVCLDYLCVHSGDFDKNMPSLHAATPNRGGEIYVHRAIIEEGLNLLYAKHLVHKCYLQTGIEYSATEESAPFIDSMGSEYCKRLHVRSTWIKHTISSNSKTELEKMIKQQATDFLFQVLR